MRVDSVPAHLEFGARLRKNGFKDIGPVGHGLMRGGPAFAALRIAEIAEEAPVVPHGILAPAGQGDIPIAAAAPPALSIITW